MEWNKNFFYTAKKIRLMYVYLNNYVLILQETNRALKRFLIKKYIF